MRSARCRIDRLLRSSCSPLRCGPDLSAPGRSISAEEGFARVRARKGEVAQPSFEQLDFLQEVAKIFAALSSAYVERIDASGSIEEIEARTAEVVRRRLNLL